MLKDIHVVDGIILTNSENLITRETLAASHLIKVFLVKYYSESTNFTVTKKPTYIHPTISMIRLRFYPHLHNIIYKYLSRNILIVIHK